MYSISANIVCKNEQYWIKESILSIVNLVDDIIYVDDNSTDSSLEIVKELSKKYNNIKIFTYEEHQLKNLGDLKNFALSKSKNEFVIRWDADFIAYDDIVNLFEYCKNNPQWDGYILSGPNLYGDINHQPIDREKFGPECYLFNKNKSKFVKNERYPDYPEFIPGFRYCYPEKTTLRKNFFFLHTNALKSLERLAFRNRMCEYHIDDKGFQDYWKWLDNLHGRENIKSLEMKNLLEREIKVKEFEFDKWGPHPKLLVESDSVSLFKTKKVDEKYYFDYDIKVINGQK